MPLFALDWNEIYTAVGFWVGVASGLIGILSLWYAILQVWKVQKAADAAKEAAEKTLAQNKSAYTKFVGSFARRLLASLEDAVGRKEWKLAVLRVNDLAELIGSSPESVPGAVGLAYQLREFGLKFAAPTPKYRIEKWNGLVLALHALLDNLNAPFRSDSDGKTDPTSGGTEAKGDRPDATPEDESRPGELGSGGSVSE